MSRTHAWCRRLPPARGGDRLEGKGAPAGEPDDHAIGRSRGGPTTKIHLASDPHCRPLVFVLTAGQAGDARSSLSSLIWFAMSRGDLS